ncbi:MAG: gluconate 2-dehydrogenase subunit 3 family protein [Pyrinomonadaceae bacterium]|nr:gluconate 2-dehydrogenase subunit 3 family protein [Pyrinomonadaceae bacterium]
MSESQEFRTRYPGYNVLDKWSSPDWDDQTREVVRHRLEDVPPVRFFTEHEARTLAAICERIVPQPDRDEALKIPIVPWIDEKLYEYKRDGYRYEELPPQRETWRLGLMGIDETSRALFDGKPFVELEPLSQDVVLHHMERGNAPGAVWEKMPASRFFKSVLSIMIVKIYYAHPRAWNEIGYAGPSSPRGHVRKWEGGRDPWEAHEEETDRVEQRGSRRL